MLYHESLVKKGLVRGAMAGYELARGEAVREAELARLGGDRARLGLQAAELEMRLNEFETSNRRQLMTELQDVRSRLRELSVSLPSASVALNYVMHQSNVGGLAPEPVRNITITRTQNGSTSVFEATELMPLEPGDVVEVKTWIAPSSSRSLNTQASTSLRRLAADRR